MQETIRLGDQSSQKEPKVSSRSENHSKVALSIGAVLIAVLLLFIIDEYVPQPRDLQPNQALSPVNYR